MSVTGSDFLTFVTDIQSTASTEIEFRNIMSRSYYSMYHSALEILKEEPPTYAGQGSHASLSTYLESNDVKTLEKHDPRSLKALSYILKQYKAKRCIADYELHETITQANATESLEAAKKFNAKCADLLKKNAV